MVISINSFEEKFSEARLKEGLALARNNLSEVVKASSGSYRFVFEKKERNVLQLGRRGNQITSWTCSCGKKLCAHLAAALFYFNNLDRALPQKTGRGELKAYSARLRKLFGEERMVSDEKISKACNDFLRGVGKRDAQIARLALLLELSKHMVYAELFPAEHVNPALKNIIDELNGLRRSKLNASEKSAWKEAGIQSLKMRNAFKSGIYLYLLPFMLGFVYDGLTLDELRDLAAKRRKEKRFFTFLNLPLLAEMMAQARQAELNGKGPASEKLSPEWLIACAELKFVNGKAKAALKLLREGNDKLKTAALLTYPSFLAYGLSRSKEAGSGEDELFFIKETLLHDRSIDVNLLDRAKHLVEKKKWKEWMMEIIREIRTQNKEWNFDKLAEIFEHENMPDELISLIKAQKNKFQLLHRAAMKKLPGYSEALFGIYVEQLESLIYEAREPYRQEKIYQLVKSYLDKLPTKASAELKNKILERISKNNSVYQLLKKD